MEKIAFDSPIVMGAIAAIVVIVLLIIIILLRRKKKKGSAKTIDQDLQEVPVIDKVEGKKYQGNEPSDEQLMEAPKIDLEHFDDGMKALSFRFRITKGKIKIDEVDPYDNEWIKIVNYNELVGQVRSENQVLHIYMNRLERKRPSRVEKALISVVYRDMNDVQWLQQIKYNSQSGIHLNSLKTLS